MNIYLAGIVTISALSCSHREKKYSINSEQINSRPSIYEAWEARYNYDPSLRKMVPIYDGRIIGKTWSRDAKGQLNHSAYIGRTEEIDENLLPLHLAKLNQDRERVWETNKRERMEDISEMLRVLEEDKKDPLVEVLIADEEEEFIPPVFIPQGIDLGQENDVTPVINESDSPRVDDAQSEAELSPFLPLP